MNESNETNKDFDIAQKPSIFETALNYLFGTASSEQDQSPTTEINPRWKSLGHYTLINTEEAGITHTGGWSLEADRHLCVLWFFTSHSLLTIASLLNYTTKFNHWVTKNMAKRRIQSLQSKSYDRAFVYYEIKRMDSIKDDWSADIRQLDIHFKSSWRRMEEQLVKENYLGEELHYDLITCEELARMGRRRRWTPVQRKSLMEKSYMGLQRVKKEVRPERVDDGYSSEASVDRDGRNNLTL